MIKYLLQQVNTPKVVSIYCDIDRPETHLTGFIQACTEEALLVRHISKEGRYDGFVLVHPNNVFRVDVDSEYERKIYTLYHLTKQSHYDLPEKGSPFASLIAFCMKEKFVISIEMEYEVLTGFIKEYNEDHIHLNIIDAYGRKNGETIVACEQIISLAVDTSVEQCIRILFTQAP